MTPVYAEKMYISKCFVLNLKKRVFEVASMVCIRLSRYFVFNGQELILARAYISRVRQNVRPAFLVFTNNASIGLSINASKRALTLFVTVKTTLMQACVLWKRNRA